MDFDHVADQLRSMGPIRRFERNFEGLSSPDEAKKIAESVAAGLENSLDKFDMVDRKIVLLSR
jgi:hypothetical protein